jgi:Glyoxalase-like domain
VTFVAVDHLVVAAASLAEGVAWCESTLGVSPGAGGRHPLMGTHNRLLKIASATYPQAYLEIIAIDPDAPAPTRRRWFGLDDLDVAGGPRLIHLVGRSPMLDMHRWGLITVGLKPGDPIKAGRDTPEGPLSWQILVRDDGRLECRGALPTLIQWEGRHPTDAMPDSGVVLKSLTLNGVPDRARDVLRLRGVAVSSAAGPALQAVFGTPRGDVTLTST